MSPESNEVPSACFACLDRRTLLTAAAGLAGAVVVGTTEPAHATPGGQWQTLGPASAVPLRSGKYYEPNPGQRVVVTQPSAGVYKAFSGYCTHQAGKVNQFPGRRMQCSSHGSQFKLNNGTVLRGPASRRLEQRQVRVRNGDIQVR